MYAYIYMYVYTYIQKYGNESQIFPKNCAMWQVTYSSPIPMDLYLTSLIGKISMD